MEFTNKMKRVLRSARTHTQICTSATNHVIFLLILFAVKKRIERTQARLDKLSNQELLLEAGHALRIEKDRQKELEVQLEQQMQDIQRANTVIRRWRNAPTAN